MLLLAFGLFYLQGGSVALQDLDLIFNTVYSAADIIETNFSQTVALIYSYLDVPDVQRQTNSVS